MVCVRIQWVNQLITLSRWVIYESLLCILYYPLLIVCGQFLKPLSSLLKGSILLYKLPGPDQLCPLQLHFSLSLQRQKLPCFHQDLNWDSQLEKDSNFNGKNPLSLFGVLFALQRTCHFCPRHCFSSLIEWRKFLKQNNEMAFLWKKFWLPSNYLWIISIVEVRVKQTVNYLWIHFYFVFFQEILLTTTLGHCFVKRRGSHFLSSITNFLPIWFYSVYKVIHHSSSAFLHLMLHEALTHSDKKQDI